MCLYVAILVLCTRICINCILWKCLGLYNHSRHNSIAFICFLLFVCSSFNIHCSLSSAVVHWSGLLGGFARHARQALWFFLAPLQIILEKSSSPSVVVMLLHEKQTEKLKNKKKNKNRKTKVKQNYILKQSRFFAWVLRGKEKQERKGETSVSNQTSQADSFKYPCLLDDTALIYCILYVCVMCCLLFWNIHKKKINLYMCLDE